MILLTGGEIAPPAHEGNQLHAPIFSWLVSFGRRCLHCQDDLRNFLSSADEVLIPVSSLQCVSERTTDLLTRLPES